MKDVKRYMLFRKSYSRSSIEVVDKDAGMRSNRERAYRYSSAKFADSYPIQSVKGTVQYLYKNTSYDLDQANYILYNFDTVDIGMPAALGESDYLLVEGVRLEYCNFHNCNIKNVIFRRCSFSGSSFKNIYFDHVVFESCIFSVPVLEDGRTGVDDLYYASSVFEVCTFVGRFSECDIEYSLFSKVCFTQTRFEKCSLKESILVGCVFGGVDVDGCDLRSFWICLTDILEMTFSAEHRSLVNEETFIDYKINARRKKDKKESSDNYDDMCLEKAKSLKAVSKLFEINGLADYGGEYFYRSKVVENRALHRFLKYFSNFELALCGFGERPLFTMITIAITTIVFGLIYMFSGVDADGYIIDYSINSGKSVEFCKAISDYGKCLFFSVTTFSTVGYGNYVPVGVVSMIVSGLHMILGISLCALWTGCVFRKVAR